MFQTAYTATTAVFLCQLTCHSADIMASLCAFRSVCSSVPQSKYKRGIPTQSVKISTQFFHLQWKGFVSYLAYMY